MMLMMVMTWKNVQWVGGMWGSLFAFFFYFYFFCVCHPVHYDFLLLFLWCERTRQSYGTAKECSLHSYQVDGWMDGLMNAWMDVTKLTEAQHGGLEQELDACLITVAFFCESLVRKKITFVCVFKFLSSCTGEKEGLLKNTLQTWRQSGTVLSLFSFIFVLKVPL